MDLLASLLVALVALLHLWFLMLEMVLWQRPLGLRTFTTWSKVWEYPWLWFNVLAGVRWPGLRLVDLGSELSPMPWVAAMLGARVTLVETDAKWVPLWQKLRAGLGVEVIQGWHWSLDIEATVTGARYSYGNSNETWTNWSLVNFAINFY